MTNRGTWKGKLIFEVSCFATKRFLNRRLNLFSGNPFYPPISYPGSKKLHRGITGFSALNTNRGKRTRKRPNWLDNCTWLGISSERLASAAGKELVTGPKVPCQSFRLKVDSPVSRSFRLHDQVVSPTRSESIRLHWRRFAYTYKSKCFVKMDEHHCLQLASF